MTDSSAPSSSFRKRRTASIVQNINLDDVGPLSIPRRSSPSPTEGAEPKLADPLVRGGAREVNSPSASSRVQNSSKSSFQGSRSGQTPPARWVQGLFAAAVLAAAGWLLFSPQRHGESSSVQQPAAKR